MVKGDSCKYIASLHEKYGEVVRVSPNELSYITTTASKTIFGNKTTEDMAFEKNPAHSRASPTRLMAPAFSEQAIKKQGPIIQEYTSIMIDALRHNRSGTAFYPSPDGIVNIGAWTNFIISDILSSLSFGKPVGCLTCGVGTTTLGHM
ncbi:hypothetical protein ASPWEDRAFT_178498 [Aspergillus wentii DTO 134E9]|uniref:Uncharacterized protein n=1 Tax=Aspergillus wentii DTO 134E9 TaxID=1073089 RepID=A0A1L9S0H2_ASPWE|nr:uncharacterized protein ASPWEDRAFT_178498 [Aspergillus wentii DTO 134E9]OJJ40651.1 hypothetical protein ASPWEDRAFT_178498 [Aspergillus wentii DTO 134E9]